MFSTMPFRCLKIKKKTPITCIQNKHVISSLAYQIVTSLMESFVQIYEELYHQSIYLSIRKSKFVYFIKTA